MIISDKKFQLIKVHEGCRLKAYKDTEGILTIGYGRNLEENFLTPKECRFVFDSNASYFITHGIPRECVYDYLEEHLDYFINVGITQDVADLLLENDIKTTQKFLDTVLWDDDLSECRKCVLVDMLFNLGKKGFMKFEDFISAIKVKHFAKAAAEIIDSKAARNPKLKRRYQELHDMMLNNEFPKWVK